MNPRTHKVHRVGLGNFIKGINKHKPKQRTQSQTCGVNRAHGEQPKSTQPKNSAWHGETSCLYKSSKLNMETNRLGNWSWGWVESRLYCTSRTPRTRAGQEKEESKTQKNTKQSNKTGERNLESQEQRWKVLVQAQRRLSDLVENLSLFSRGLRDKVRKKSGGVWRLGNLSACSGWSLFT